MSIIVVGGRAYAAGLYWLGRTGPRATARAARRLGRPWCVHHGERTGFAAGDEGGRPKGAAPEGPGLEDLDSEGAGPAGLHPEGFGPAGLAALALALKEHIDGEFWMALVGGHGSDGEGRYALVKARDGAVLADGDEVFGDHATAVAAFERARPLGWSLHATPGLAAELGGSEVAALDVAALDAAAAAAGAAIVLEPASRQRAGRRLVPALLSLAVIAGMAAVWLEREALIAWLAGPAPEPAPAAARPEPTVAVAVDGAALIAACRQALIDNPPYLPGWRIESIACTARFDDAALTALRPELAGRPVLLVRWQRRPGHSEALQRRLAEAHLARRHAAQVADGRAWAAVPLAPVLRVAEGAVPSFLALRRAVDRAFGAAGARIAYARGADGGWTVRIDDAGPLARLAPLAGGIAGLEIAALTRGEDGPWRLEGRPAAPETVAASGLAALGLAGRSPPPGSPPVRHVHAPAAAGTIQAEKEADNGIELHAGP